MKLEIVIGRKCFRELCVTSGVFPAVKLDILLTSELSLELEVLDDLGRIVERDVLRHVVTKSERGPKR